MMANKVKLPVPPPVLVLVKLRVVVDLRIDAAFYTAGHEIEVFYAEARQLLDRYPDHFEVVIS